MDLLYYGNWDQNYFGKIQLAKADVDMNHNIIMEKTSNMHYTRHTSNCSIHIICDSILFFVLDIKCLLNKNTGKNDVQALVRVMAWSFLPKSKIIFIVFV